MDINNLSTENLAEIAYKNYDEEKELLKVANTMTNDQRVIERIMIYDKGIENASIL